MLESGIIVLQTPTTPTTEFNEPFFTNLSPTKNGNKKERKKTKNWMSEETNYTRYTSIPSSKSSYVLLLSYTGAVYGRKPPTSQKEATSLRNREEGRAEQSRAQI
jgi:hypothetical protein